MDAMVEAMRVRVPQDGADGIRARGGALRASDTAGNARGAVAGPGHIGTPGPAAGCDATVASTNDGDGAPSRVVVRYI